MAKFIDLTGVVIDDLIVVGRAKDRMNIKFGKPRTIWKCKCKCGVVVERSLNYLQKIIKKRSSVIEMWRVCCGCSHAEAKKQMGIVVGNLEKKGKHKKSRTHEYNTWSNLKSRCSIKRKSPIYKNYWGSGIKVCDRWMDSFENFYSDMGPRPNDKSSIDRIDTNGNYEPNNCRWATDKEQGINKNTTRWITYKGITKPITYWSVLIPGGRLNTLHNRLKNGWPIETAIETPTSKHNRIKNAKA